MNLRSFLDSLPRGGIAEFAKELRISPVYLSQLASGQDGRQPSPGLCKDIQIKSGGKVTCRELRTDWRRIWPELERRQSPREPAENKT